MAYLFKSGNNVFPLKFNLMILAIMSEMPSVLVGYPIKETWKHILLILMEYHIIYQNGWNQSRRQTIINITYPNKLSKHNFSSSYIFVWVGRAHSGISVSERRVGSKGSSVVWSGREVQKRSWQLISCLQPTADHRDPSTGRPSGHSTGHWVSAR